MRDESEEVNLLHGEKSGKNTVQMEVYTDHWPTSTIWMTFFLNTSRNYLKHRTGH